MRLVNLSTRTVTVFKKGNFFTESITISPNSHIDVDFTVWYKNQIFHNMNIVGPKLLYFITQNGSIFEQLVLPLTEAETSDYISSTLGTKYYSEKGTAPYKLTVFNRQEGVPATYVHKRYNYLIQHFPKIANHCV